MTDQPIDFNEVRAIKSDIEAQENMESWLARTYGTDIMIRWQDAPDESVRIFEHSGVTFGLFAGRGNKKGRFYLFTEAPGRDEGVWIDSVADAEDFIWQVFAKAQELREYKRRLARAKREIKP